MRRRLLSNRGLEFKNDFTIPISYYSRQPELFGNVVVNFSTTSSGVSSSPYSITTPINGGGTSITLSANSLTSTLGESGMNAKKGDTIYYSLTFQSNGQGVLIPSLNSITLSRSITVDRLLSNMGDSTWYNSRITASANKQYILPYETTSNLNILYSFASFGTLSSSNPDFVLDSRSAGGSTMSFGIITRTITVGENTNKNSRSTNITILTPVNTLNDAIVDKTVVVKQYEKMTGIWLMLNLDKLETRSKFKFKFKNDYLQICMPKDYIKNYNYLQGDMAKASYWFKNTEFILDPSDDTFCVQIYDNNNGIWNIFGPMNFATPDEYLYDDENYARMYFTFEIQYMESSGTWRHYYDLDVQIRHKYLSYAYSELDLKDDIFTQGRSWANMSDISLILKYDDYY